MTSTYRKIFPEVIVEATVLKGHDDAQDNEPWVQSAFDSKTVTWVDDDGGYFRVHTAGGPKRGQAGDYLVQASTGELDVMTQSAFERQYEAAKGDVVRKVKAEQQVEQQVEQTPSEDPVPDAAT